MIHSFVFSEGRLVGSDLELEALRLVRADKGLMLWVDLDNPSDDEVKQILDGVFQFHPLAIEDCVTPSSLPKIEDYDEYLFMVMHAVDFKRAEKFNTTELDLFLGKDYLVTYHRLPLRSVQSMMDRCSKAIGIVARGPDRLAHTLLDLLVDNYSPAFDELRAELEEIEEHMLGPAAQKNPIGELLQVRADFTRLRQIVRPQRDVVERLAHGESKMVRALMLPYYRDLRDNLARLEETAANYHDRLMLGFDIFLNKATFEVNEGIKVLTALTALTTPAILVGSWYGMNFQHMPELGFWASYPLLWIVTIGATIWTWRFLKRKRLL